MSSRRIHAKQSMVIIALAFLTLGTIFNLLKVGHVAAPQPLPESNEYRQTSSYNPASLASRPTDTRAPSKETPFQEGPIVNDKISIRGRVIDSITRNPLLASGNLSRFQGDEFDLDKLEFSTPIKCDHYGVFSAEGLTEGSYKLTLNVPEYAVGGFSVLQISRSTDDILVALERFSSIVGRVFMPDGYTPAAGAHIRVFRSPNSTNGSGGMKSFVVADNGGNFELTSIRPGPQRIAATYAGLAGVFSERLEVQPGERRRIRDLKLKVGGGIRGRIALAGHDPIAFSRVRVIPSDPILLSLVDRRSDESTDERGEFIATPLPEGSWIVHIYGAGTSRGRLFSAAVKVKDGEVATLKLEIGKSLGVTARGKVLRDGRAQVGAGVRLVSYSGEPAAESYLERFSSTSTTDEAGEFLFDGVPSGLAKLEIWSGSGTEIVRSFSKWINIRKSEGNYFWVQIQAEATLSVCVFDERTHRPLAGIPITINPSAGRQYDLATAEVKGVTDQNGSFSTRELQPSEYLITAGVLKAVETNGEPLSFAARTVGPLQVDSSWPTVINIGLTRGFRAVVAAEDEAGVRLSGVSIALQEHFDEKSHREVICGVSDWDGLVHLANVPRGRISILARKEGYVLAKTVVDGGEGEGTVTAKLVLHRGNRVVIRGIVDESPVVLERAILRSIGGETYSIGSRSDLPDNTSPGLEIWADPGVYVLVVSSIDGRVVEQMVEVGEEENQFIVVNMSSRHNK